MENVVEATPLCMRDMRVALHYTKSEYLSGVFAVHQKSLEVVSERLHQLRMWLDFSKRLALGD